MSIQLPQLKIVPATVTNNDVSTNHINFHKQINGLDHVDLPEEYLAFIKQYGEGAIGGHIYIFPLDKLMARTQFWRSDNQTKAEAKFFKEDNRNDCSVIGETSDGDMILYLNAVYYLSTRQFEEKIYKLGPTLDNVLEFHKSNKKYGGRCDVNSFKRVLRN